MTKSYFNLYFMSGNETQLFQTEFLLSHFEQSIRTVRGRSAGALKSRGTFQFSAAVQALSMLMVKCVLYGDDDSARTLIGGRGSFASSLDFAISKEPQWLIEMFGSTISGRSNAARLFLRINPNRKFPGPVIVGLNTMLLTPFDIKIFVDDIPYTNEAMLINLLDELGRSRQTDSTSGLSRSDTPVSAHNITPTL